MHRCWLRLHECWSTSAHLKQQRLTRMRPHKVTGCHQVGVLVAMPVDNQNPALRLMRCADAACLVPAGLDASLTTDAHKLCRCTSVWFGVFGCSAERPAAAAGIPAGNRGGWQPGCCWNRSPSSSRATARGFLWATHRQHAGAVPSCQRSRSQHQVGGDISNTPFIRGCCQLCANCCLRQDQPCALASKHVQPACAPFGS